MVQTENPHESAFAIRTFHFRELALLYFPTNTPTSASQAFRRMIRAYKGLTELISAKGFAPRCKVMPPAVVEIIVSHLGEP